MRGIIAFATCILAVTAVPADRSPAVTLRDYLNGNSRAGHRIINGNPAASAQFPWQVGVLGSMEGVISFCGGALISDQWVLTAGHCGQGFRQFVLYLGGITLDNDEDGQIQLLVEGSNAIVHPDYSNLTLNNDLALIRLYDPVAFTDTIQPIRLPARGSRVEAGVNVVVSGWGQTSDAINSLSDSLNWVELTTITNERCFSTYQTIIIDSTLCAVGNPKQSPCNGDSGGPLVSFENGEAVLQGVASFVHFSGCESGNPSGYVRTASMLDWIAENTGLDV